MQPVPARCPEVREPRLPPRTAARRPGSRPGGADGSGGRGRRARRRRPGHCHWPRRRLGRLPPGLASPGLALPGLAAPVTPDGAAPPSLSLRALFVLIVGLGFEHPGYLPSGSRARGSARNPPLRAGAGRTRSLGGGRPARPIALPGALSLRVLAPCPVRLTEPERPYPDEGVPPQGTPSLGGPGGHCCPAGPASAATATSGPCASRVTSGGDEGTSPATRRSAFRMSSGRTAGVRCRTTIRSIAYPAFRSSAAHQSASIVSTAARASMRRIPLLVRRSTSTLP